LRARPEGRVDEANSDVSAGSTGRGLQVIGAGFGRSGTTSLRKALHILGFAPCYHMQTTLTHYADMKFWVRAKAGEPVDFRRFFRRYRATVDWPACEFYRELMAAFPDAKVLLNVREPEEWYDSMIDTLWVIQRVLPWWFPGVARKLHDDIVWNARFNGEFPDRAKSIAVYRAHLEEVRRTVPPERLLVYSVKEGWKPLCDFLGRPVPEHVPFPRLNDRVFFKRLIRGLVVIEWLAPALVLGGLVWLGFRLA
jgi:hypothetical protein